MESTPQIEPWRVVVAGGGVAGLEACLGLADLGERQLRVALVTPEDHFTLQPQAVAEPFGGRPAPTVALADVARELGMRFVRDRVVRVRPDEMTVQLEHRGDEPYDALILATGARHVPAGDRALTFDGEAAVPAMREILGNLTSGRIADVAFVVPAGASWSLPMYELALLTRRHAGHGNVMLVTPEPSPLALFGPEPSRAVGELLAAAGIELHLAAEPCVRADGRAVGLAPDGPWLSADRVVTLPALVGPAIDGVPHDGEGFVPVDEFARVRGTAPGGPPPAASYDFAANTIAGPPPAPLHHVYAVGDGTDQPVKQGGLAAQQAYAAVRHLTSEAGGPLGPEPFRPVLRGRLLTGGLDRFLRHTPEGADAVSDERLWWPPAKVVGHYLAPWLAERMRERRWVRPPREGIDVERYLPPERDPAVLGLEPYGPMHR
jgi:sulfide:quinone oxidoreductase